MLTLAFAFLCSVAPLQASAKSVHSEFLKQHTNSPSFLENYRHRPLKNNAANESETNQFNSIVYGYLPYWTDSDAPIAWEHLTHLAYFSVEMNSDGSLGNDHGWESRGAQLVQAGQAHSVTVVLTATFMDNEGIRTLLANPNYRQNAIDNLLAKVQAAGGQGINIDFEFVPAPNPDESPTPKKNFVTFISDLTLAFHSTIPGSHVSLATPAIDWNGSFDYDALAAISDGLMIMGYGYHWQGGNPGPISPIASGTTWGVHNLTWTIADYKQWGLEENSHKFILGLPLYGRDWPAQDHSIPGQATANGQAISLSRCDTSWNGQKLWDEDAQVPFKLYFDETTPRQLFCEDVPSLEAKFELIQSENIGGVMFWDLGKVGANHPLWESVDAFFKLPDDTNPGSDTDTDTDTDTGTEPGSGSGENQAPIAHISAEQEYYIDVPIIIHAKDSFDSDGDALTYKWEQIGGADLIIYGRNSVSMETQASEVGRYSFRLTVSDGGLESTATATLNISRPLNSATAPTGCNSSSPSAWMLLVTGVWYFRLSRR